MTGHNWVLVDQFVKGPQIKNWDATKLDEVEDGTLDKIYASHLLEHFPHVDVQAILHTWYRKLKTGGELIINVPDLGWAAKQLLHYEEGYLLNGYYNTFAGEHGLLSIFYGSESHEGEYHKGGFIYSHLEKLLKETGFSFIEIKREVEAHEMGCLIAKAIK
jgi:ubiquinone/menaquinone biosynthesis C-methylase UbiE